MTMVWLPIRGSCVQRSALKQIVSQSEEESRTGDDSACVQSR
jgi:hypothetical protein